MRTLALIGDPHVDCQIGIRKEMGTAPTVCREKREGEKTNALTLDDESKGEKESNRNSDPTEEGSLLVRRFCLQLPVPHGSFPCLGRYRSHPSCCQ